jgi:hypothetical protein
MKSELAMHLRNPGIFIARGQPWMQFGSEHSLQREASAIAVSIENPSSTSEKFRRRISGACLGISLRFRSVLYDDIGGALFGSAFQHTYRYQQTPDITRGGTKQNAADNVDFTETHEISVNRGVFRSGSVSKSSLS